jgi:Transposase
MIGVDPHKATHTAVVIGPAEEPLRELRIRASAGQAEKLVAWAAEWPERTWAVEGAAGLGRLLAQQLVAAGERVLDVQPKLASRVRLLQAGDTNKNDPNDALSVAVAALRSKTARPVMAEDYPAVLKVRSKRHRDLAAPALPAAASSASALGCSRNGAVSGYGRAGGTIAGRSDRDHRDPAPAIAMARRGQAGRRPADPVNEIVTSKTAASQGQLRRRRRWTPAPWSTWHSGWRTRTTRPTPAPRSGQERTPPATGAR